MMNFFRRKRNVSISLLGQKLSLRFPKYVREIISNKNVTVTLGGFQLSMATKSVTVLLSNQRVASIVITPTGAQSYTVGTSFGMTATPYDNFGNVIAVPIPGLSWAVSGPPGVVNFLQDFVTGRTAAVSVVGAGSVSIYATWYDSVSATTISSPQLNLTATAVSSASNEPIGFRRIAEANFSVLPGTGTGVVANQVAGYWWRENPTDPVVGSSGLTAADCISIVSDPTAPQSPSNVLSCLFPAGLDAGYHSVYFIGWEDASLGVATNAPAYDEVYMRVRMRTKDPTYQNNAVYTKIFYITSAEVLNRGVLGLDNATDGDGVIDTRGHFRVSQTLFQDSGDPNTWGSNNFDPNVDTRELFTYGVWHDVEMYFKSNTLDGDDPSPANGVLKIWIDGVLTHHYTTIRNRSWKYSRGFYQWRWAMVYGGSGLTKSRNDWLYFDHIYISGNPSTKNLYAYQPIGLHNFTALPVTANAQYGSWGHNVDPTFYAENDATDPTGDGKVIVYKFETGLVGGYSPGKCWFTPPTRYEKMYLRFWIKYDNPDFERCASSQACKILFVGSSGQSSVNNEVILGLYGSGEPIIGTSLPLWVSTQGFQAAAYYALTGAPRVTFGSWHQIEMIMEQNTIGVANGKLRVYLDNVLAISHDTVVWRNATYPLGFKDTTIAPYWGGTTGVKTRDDYMRIAQFFCSGVV